MSENIRIILRDESSELFKNNKFKLSPVLLNAYQTLTTDSNKVEGTISDISTLTLRGLVDGISGFYDLAGVKLNVTKENQASLYTDINAIRADDGTDSDIKLRIGSSVESDTTLEKIPVKKHANETRAILSRMQSEYTSKLTKLQFLRNNLFDPDYALDMFYIGTTTNVNSRLVTVSANERTLRSTPDNTFDISGYIKVENASTSITMEMYIRGIPILMRKTQTSVNSDGTRNYIFTYPQYIINTNESARSIQYINILNSGANAQFFLGSDYGFPAPVGDGDYINLAIENKASRNIQ
jgi:hypothetical protein